MELLDRIRPGSRSDEEARNLAQLAAAIELYFRGRVPREQDALDLMAAKFRWGSRTTRKRLHRLSELGVLRWWRDVDDHWTKVWQLVTEDGPEASEETSLATG